MDINSSALALKTYCEEEDYKGWDPYDGLNSKIFQATPLKQWPFARLAWIQLFKRNPVNLRKLFLVPKGHNPKALGLFLTGYCNFYKIAKQGNAKFGSPEEIRKKIRILADLLLELKTPGYSGACWGYNFDWQSKAFFLPDRTPTVVATAFVVDALHLAYECTAEKKYLETVKSAGNFVLNDLNRINKGKSLYMFSYSPLDNRAVYNATLLGSKILSLIYSYTKEKSYKDGAYASAKAVCDTQKKNGAFPHSDQVGDLWRDNFHTGFKLECLSTYETKCNDNSFDSNIKEGLKYWIDNFFLDNGISRYYDNNTYPIDLHCPSQAIVTLYKTGAINEYQSLAKKIIEWPVKNMQNEKGYFYFQKHKKYLNRIEYMRWPNAWMFYGLSYWILHLEEINDEKN